jgi:repressor of nif and glnA expression
MIGSERKDVERKVVNILRILSESTEPLGARVIAQHLREYGIDLGERAVRYHLKILDEKGLTRLIGRDGRVITGAGGEELRSALVSDKVGFVIGKIEVLAVKTTFDVDKRRGNVPVNVSLFPSEQFDLAKTEMMDVFKAGYCISDLVAVAGGGERLAGVMVPEDKIGFATVCSIVVNGALLKAGIPMDSRFGGLLQIKDNEPLRFAELIQYTGSSLDPSEIFITSRMTSVREVVGRGEGNVLANFREIPVLCGAVAEKVFRSLKKARLGGVLVMGKVSQPVCEVPVELNKMGIVIQGGLNPVAAAVEAGIQVDNIAMSGVIEYRDLVRFSEV